MLNLFWFEAQLALIRCDICGVPCWICSYSHWELFRTDVPKTICYNKNLNIHITLELIETRRIRMSMSVFVFWRKQCIVHGPLIKRFSRKKSENELYQAIVFFLIKVVLYWPWNKTFIHLWKTKQTNLSRPKVSEKILFLKFNSF